MRDVCSHARACMRACTGHPRACAIASRVRAALACWAHCVATWMVHHLTTCVTPRRARDVLQAQGRYAIQPLGIGDGTTASAMVSGIALALRHRLLTHEGMLVDAALLRVGMWCMVRTHPKPSYSAAPADRYPRGPRARGVFGAGGRAGGPKAAGAGQNAKRRPIRLGFADPRLRETASAALCHVRIPTARPFPRRQRCASAHALRLGSSLPHLHRILARHLHRDSARACHICTATRLAPCPQPAQAPAQAILGVTDGGARSASVRFGSDRSIDRSIDSLTGRRRTHRRMANSSC